MGAIPQTMIDLGGGMGTAQEWNDIYETIQFGLRISLDDRFEFSEKRFNNVATNHERHLPNSKSALETEMSVEPR